MIALVETVVLTVKVAAVVILVVLIQWIPFGLTKEETKIMCKTTCYNDVEKNWALSNNECLDEGRSVPS